jgi:hypothetical protein
MKHCLTDVRHTTEQYSSNNYNFMSVERRSDADQRHARNQDGGIFAALPTDYVLNENMVIVASFMTRFAFLSK